MSVFVAEHEAAGVIGTVAAALRDDGSGHLRGMAVLPAWHQRGVAPRLLRRALDELVASGRRRATLGTTAPLVRAMRFYEARGFERTGGVRDFLGMPLFEYAKALDAWVETVVTSSLFLSDQLHPASRSRSALQSSAPADAWR